MFDSFCKKVSKNYAIDLDRASDSPKKHYSEEPVDYFLELLGRRETYISDAFVLYTDGYSCTVESETLYKALLSLPDKQSRVILLDFWAELTDGEIAKRLEVTTHTVYNLRQRAFQKIRKYYER